MYGCYNAPYLSRCCYAGGGVGGFTAARAPFGAPASPPPTTRAPPPALCARQWRHRRPTQRAPLLLRPRRPHAVLPRARRRVGAGEGGHQQRRGGAPREFRLHVLLRAQCVEQPHLQRRRRWRGRARRARRPRGPDLALAVHVLEDRHGRLVALAEAAAQHARVAPHAGAGKRGRRGEGEGGGRA